MASAPENRKSGIQGDRVILDRSFAGDDDRFVVNGKNPVVEIYAPAGNLIQSSAAKNAKQPERLGIGEYVYTYLPPLTDQASDQYLVVWKIRIKAQDLVFSEYFTVGAVQAEPGLPEFRVGFAFKNPDVTSDLLAPGWGQIITADELRYIVLFGIKLVSPEDNQVYDDNMLAYYVEQAIGVIEGELNMCILPRIVLHADPKDGNGKRIDRFTLAPVDPNAIPIADDTGILQDDLDYINRMTDAQKQRLVVREQGYPYRRNTAFNNYMHMQTRLRPITRLTNPKLVDPVNRTFVDLNPYVEVEYGMSGKIQFSFTQIGSSPPFFITGVRYPFADYPVAYQFDYHAGYANCTAVPVDLRELVRLYAGLLIMNDYGDVKLPGIASQSIGLNGLSESFSTTQSAENSLYGARIREYAKQFDTIYKRVRYHYGTQLLGVL